MYFIIVDLSCFDIKPSRAYRVSAAAKSDPGAMTFLRPGQTDRRQNYYNNYY